MTAVEALISHGCSSLAPRATALSPSAGRLHHPHLPSRGCGVFPLRRMGVKNHPHLHLRNQFRMRSLPSGRLIPFATASHEGSDNYPDAEVEKMKNELEKQSEESQEAWKSTIESFKEQAAKMKDMSEEAYELYSKKAMVVFKDFSEQVKVQTEKARKDMSLIAEEVTTEGREYLSSAMENPPEPVKEIVETFTSEGAELKKISEVRDFFLGIPYGALLSMSILSLRSWKEGKSSALFLQGQAGIAAILFVREARLLCQRPSVWTSIMALISGIMAAFYVYRIKIESWNREGESGSLN
ncbi:protein FATTY ACID EXPORT 3, chloroplastic-like isoform X2 [Nymphaea colorata]|uniref:protein FATTY ACID EXPORT 3, chloroplastic-like isoform X2 n=1 Tax=Nymphaea colorata TaxID=210225 RepID=UPI00214F168A|nr:protein FATTY ACID EXPORT 3, chloroplastic-like isoform X2 [Nymphaea colorata]